MKRRGGRHSDFDPSALNVGEATLHQHPGFVGVGFVPAPDDPDNTCRFPNAFRGLLAVSQIATVVISWKLWEVRQYPPLLPLFPVPQFDMAWPMLIAITASFFSPRYGLPLQAATLLWAIVSDQCRIQPQMLSMLYLSCGTLTSCWGGGVIARASLISLWFFSGIHKLMSPAFYTQGVPWLLGALGLPRDGVLPMLCGAGIGATEVLLGIGCLIPTLRKTVALSAFVFHVTILVILSPLGINWNPEVLPWNAALACAGFALIAPWKDAVPGVAWWNSSRLTRVVAFALLFSPIGYWLGVVDAYLAHCLYSENTPRAFVCTPFDRRDIQGICVAEGIPIPPAHRLFQPLFLGMGRSGEWLEIEDPRWVAKWRGLAPRKVMWSDLLPDDTQIVIPGGGSTPDTDRNRE